MKFRINSKNSWATILGLLLFLAVSYLSIEEPVELSGRVVAVQDGDTVTFLTSGNESIRVRLSQIDAPEKNQPYGQNSKALLSDLVYLKEVKLIEEDTDRYGRVVGTLFIGGRDINAEMIRLGAAWVYDEYIFDQSLYYLQDEAKLEKRGIWSLPENQQIAPWKWRKKQKAE